MTQPEQNVEFDRTGKTVYEQLDNLYDRLDALENSGNASADDVEPAGSANHPVTPADGVSPTTPEQE